MIKSSNRLLSTCRHTLTIALVVSSLLASTNASATVFTWSGGGANTSWSTTGNWSNGIAPTTGNDLLFNNSSRTTNVNNIGSLQIGTIQFGDSASAFTVSGSLVYLGSITNSSSYLQTLNLAVSQSTSGTYDAASNITIGGALSGSGDIVKNGAGTLALNGSKSGYTGTLTVNEGTLSIGTSGMAFTKLVMQADTVLATTQIGGNLTLKSLEFAGTNVSLPSNALALNNGGLTNSSGSQVTVNNVTSFNGISTINVGSDGMTLAGAVTGSGTISSIGSGLLDLTNDSNLFSGRFNVNAGTTRLSAGMTADFYVANGATLQSTLHGVGAVNKVTLLDGGTLLPGSENAIGSITSASDVIMASTSTVKFEIAGASASEPGVGGTDFDQVNVAANFSGNLHYDGYLDFNFSTSTLFDNGVSFQLFTYPNPGEFPDVTITGDLAGINQTTGVGSKYADLSFTSYNNFSNVAERDFLAAKFGFQQGDWISSWSNDHQRLIFSQSAGTLTVVPEPSTIVFAGIGMAMFGWSTWTRRRANARRQAINTSIA